MSLALQSVIILLSYFGVLWLISKITAKTESNEAFFNAGRSSKWFVVAFGMVGASLSGVTFLSVPGWVASSGWTYMQIVLGYLVGYVVIAYVLLPIYYRLNLTSIYTYLSERFGRTSYKTGAIFFLLSRIVGASFRLFLVAKVFQVLIFDPLGLPFLLNVAITILLIWVYTLKGGMKTIVWTDTLQTAFMLVGAIVCVYQLLDVMQLDISAAMASLSETMRGPDQGALNQVFVFGDWKDKTHFVKQFLSGMFIAIVMTGLDQDMMQKNLTCKNLKDAQKNVLSLGVALIPVNLLFLFLGGLLTLFATQNGLEVTGGDQLFNSVANSGMLPASVGVLFLLGLVAAAYSSADSALTSLTTVFCIDILDMKGEGEGELKKRKLVHLLMSVVLFIVISFFYLLNDDSVISLLFKFAGYTYGPLLGLFSFGIFTRFKVKDLFVFAVACIAPILTGLLNWYLISFHEFDFGFFLLIINGIITFLGLLLLVDRKVG